jgi:hypothetical protein
MEPPDRSVADAVEAAPEMIRLEGLYGGEGGIRT